MTKQLTIILQLLLAAQTHASFELTLMPMVEKWAVLGGIPISQESLPLTIAKPGKYIVIEPLSHEPTSADVAITIASENVTLDLNGFTLHWADGQTGIEINEGISHTVIKHGSVQHAQRYGISFAKDCSAIELNNLTIIGCGTVGVSIAEGCDSIVIQNSLFNDNGANSNGVPLVGDTHLISTFSRLLYTTASAGAINDRGWYTLLQMEQPLSAGLYIRGTPEDRCANIQIHDCMFNENSGQQNVAGLVIAFANSVQLRGSQCVSNMVTSSGTVSRTTGALLAAVHTAEVADCIFAENICAGDGVPSGLCLQGFAINDAPLNVRCSGIRIENCIARNNHRSLDGAPALDIHGSNFDKLWADGITMINCQSSHAARLYQVQECCNVSYIDCEASGFMGSDIAPAIDNGLRGFANHQSANIVHERCRVLNLDQNNEHPSSFQGAEGFYASIEDVVNLAGTKRVGVGMSASPFDIFMTVTPLTGLIYRDCVVDQVSDASIDKSNAFGITIRGGQACLISHCVINGAKRIDPTGMIVSGTGISLEDARESGDGSPIIGGERYNQDNWVMGNEIFGCQTGIGDISLATTTTARCAYLENKVFRAEFPYAFSPELMAATPILLWPLSSGKQPPSLDAAGNPPTQWTNIAIQ